MTTQTVDLVSVFSDVTKTLKANKETLNQADVYNKDHGTNMVKTFSTITNALKTKKGSDQGEALAYAAELLSQKSKSSSSQLYAQGLQQASQQVRGKSIDAQTGLQLLQTLLGGGQTSPQASSPQSGAGDLLGSLLGGGQGSSQSGGMSDLLGTLLGGGQSSQTSSSGGDLLGSLLGGGQSSSQSSQSSSGSGDLLGSLLGGLTGSQQSGQQSGGLSDGLDIGDLLTAGMAFMQAKQQGGNTMSALVSAFVAASGMGKSAHRQQSTQLVADTFLQALGKFAK